MASFSWSKKQVYLKRSALWEEAEDADSTLQDEHSKPSKTCRKLENLETRVERLEREGINFAELGKYQEALAKWDEALSLKSDNYKILEMRAQAFIEMNMPYPAVKSAEEAIKLNPIWWIGYQTLGRAQVNMGLIEMAIRSFSIAVHLNPSVEELWEDDLKHAVTLLSERKRLENGPLP